MTAAPASGILFASRKSGAADDQTRERIGKPYNQSGPATSAKGDRAWYRTLRAMNMMERLPAVNGEGASSDAITFLRARVPLSKRIAFRDGAWTKEPAPLAKHYDVTTRKVRGLDDLAHHVEQMGARGDTIAVHGALRPGLDPAGVLRRKTSFWPVPHRWVAVDLDKLDDFPADPAEAATRARAMLPEAFREAAAVWQASAGHALAPGKARLRLWFWCDRAVSLPEVRAWFHGCEAQPDAAIWRDVQPVYLGVKVEGAPDPVSRRIGRLRGAAVVAVPEINAAAMAEVERGTTVREGVETDSPHMIVQALGFLPQRNAARIEHGGGRRLAWFGVANDFLDRAVSEETTLAVLTCWSFPDDEAERDLVEALTDAGVRDATDHARHVRHLGEGLRDTWESGEPLDFDEVERMIGDAATSRTSPIGVRWADIPGAAFGAVVDEDAPQAVTVDGPQAFARLLDAVTFDDDTAAPEAALREAMNENSLKRAQAATLDKLLGSIRAGTALPRSFDDMRRAVLAPPAPAYESRASLRVRPRSSVRWIVDNLIAAESLFVVHGREKTGKSLIATDLAYSVAYGREWGGRKVHRTGVLVVCPEGPHGFALRQDAWHNRQAAIGHAEDDGPIETRRVSTDLFGSDEHLKAIVEQVRTFKARHGIECGLVLFDTFRAVTPGADESSARDVGMFTAKLARLRDACRCAVGYVHHDGKDAAKGASGSTAHTANVDSVLQVRRTKGGCVLDPVMQRDTGDTRATHFDIVEHDAREDDEGTMQRAPVAVMRKGQAEPQAKAVDGSAMGAVEDPDDEVPAGEIAGGVQVPEHAAEIVALVAAQAGGKPETWVKAGPVLREFNHARNHPKRRGEQLSARTMSDRLSDLATAGLLRQDGERGGVRYALPEAT